MPGLLHNRAPVVRRESEYCERLAYDYIISHLDLVEQQSLIRASILNGTLPEGKVIVEEYLERLADFDFTARQCGRVCAEHDTPLIPSGLCAVCTWEAPII